MSAIVYLQKCCGPNNTGPLWLSWLDFHGQKTFLIFLMYLCSWGWLNDDKILIDEWTIPSFQILTHGKGKMIFILVLLI